jgi:uncharacterized protein (TIGR03067 family)
VTLEHNGQKFSADAVKKFSLVIRDDTITFNPDTAKRAASIKLGPASKPKSIVLTPFDVPGRVPPVRGIYALEDSRLRLCVDNDEGTAVPTDFATKHGSGLTLIVLERAGETKKVEDAEDTNLQVEKAFLTLTGSGAPVRAVAFSPDGRAVFTGAEDGSVYFWDAATGGVRAKFSDNEFRCRSLAVSPDGKLVAVAAASRGKRLELGTVWVFEAGTAKLVLNLKEQAEPTTAVAFSPDARTLVTASGGTISFLDVPTGERRRKWRGHTSTITALAFSPDGKLLASAGADRSVKLWDPATEKEILAFVPHTDEVTAVRFSPDGKRILTAGKDGTARLWDVGTAQEIRRFGDQKKAVYSVVSSPDGALIATAGADGLVKLFNLGTGRQVSVFAADLKEVHGLAFSPDGKVIASAGADGAVRLWRFGQ